MFSTELPSKHGFFYKSIGRKTVQSEKIDHILKQQIIVAFLSEILTGKSDIMLKKY